MIERSELPRVRGPARLLATTVTGQNAGDDRGGGIAQRPRSRAIDIGVAVGAGGLWSAAAGRCGRVWAEHSGAPNGRVAAPACADVVGRPPRPAAADPRARDELWRLAETLNEMLARNEAAFARERAFVDDASHELRTPLAILRAELEISLRGDESHEELRQTLISAVEETDRLSQLVDDLLVLARADQGKLPLRCESLRLAELMALASRRAFARRLRLPVEPSRYRRAMAFS